MNQSVININVIDEYRIIVSHVLKDPYSYNQSTLNHVNRLALQIQDINAIQRFVKYIKENQNPDGSWSYLPQQPGLIGITSTILQLLFWSLDVNSTTILSETDELEIVIRRGLTYILDQKHTQQPFWEESHSSQRFHGILDLNHYILQALYYVRLYQKVLYSRTLLEDLAAKLNKFYIVSQAADGGWHEIGKKRYRTGTTADAVRALLPNIENKTYIERGIMFLCNNLNPYDGYWDAGNIDKSFDSLKAMINAYWMLEIKDIVLENIEKGVCYLSNLNYEKFSLEEKCDYLTICIDYLNLLEEPDKERVYF